MTPDSHHRMLPLTRTDGTSRDERLEGLPAPPGLTVDGMDLPRRLAMAAAYANQVAFMGEDNTPSGSWKGLFTADASMLLALIACAPLEAAEKRMRRYRRRYQGEAARAMVLLIYQVARLLNEWYQALLDCQGQESHGLLSSLSNHIQRRLRVALGALYRAEHSLEGEFTGRGPLVTPRAFHPVWRLEEFMASQGEDEQGVHPDLFSPFYNAALHLRAEARQRFSSSLVTEDHNPAAGLFIAFLTLYQKAADGINAFPGRHRDLYYDGILGFSQKQRHVDGLYLALFSDGTPSVVSVPAETAFVGGKESLGHDIICRTEGALTVHQGQVARVETFFLERHPLISPECDLGLVSATRHAVHVIEDQEAEESSPGAEGWSLYGAPHAEGDEGGEATLGFAVAATVLNLAEGTRSIEMTLGAEPLDKETAVFFEQTLRGLETSRKEGRKGALRLLFGNAFCFFFSTAEGWHPVSDSGLSFDAADTGPTLTFRMGLSPQDPAVVPCTAEVHGEMFLGTSGAPVLRVILNPQAHVNPYTLLSRIRLKSVGICVKVSGARALSLANNLGLLDPNTPFAPFGPLPKCGSFLVMGHRESAIKQVTEQSVALTWSELPRSSGGFADHYKGYGVSIDNTSFKVNLAVLKQGQWVEDAASASCALFAEDPEPGEKPATTGALLCTSKKLLEAAPLEAGDFQFGPGSRDGFYRFQLTAPEMAFGHRLYPQLLTRGLMLQSKVKKMVTLPNAPYTPMVSGVSLDYEAVETLELSSGQGSGRFYHLYPSGFDRLDDREEGEEISLIPKLEGDGHLFIGVRGEKLAGRVNLLFALQGDGVHSFGLPFSETRWAYLEADRWQPLSKRRVLEDSTRGFLTSGLVSLDLPVEGIPKAHTVMPTGLFWLRATPHVSGGDAASLQNLMASLSRCRTVVLNGIFARIEGGTGEKMPGGGLFRPANSLAGVGGVRQVLDSFGGRGSETPDERMARIGERLRHKGRAVTPWDVERLLLEREPEVRKVKCFPCMSLEQRRHPGHVLVAVLPDLRGEVSQPPLFTLLALGRMADFLRKILCDHAALDVINPVYERIQVRCTLTLTEGHGDALGRVHRSISDFLSPWVADIGYPARFGWCVREAEVESHIAAHPDVVAVTDFSMLHLVCSPEEGYAMTDTVIMADAQADKAASNPCEGVSDESIAITRKEIRPVTPWSIAISADAHFLQTIPEPRPIAPQRTGVGELEVGRTFIV